jgi:signal transduction histidine kinase
MTTSAAPASSRISWAALDAISGPGVITLRTRAENGAPIIEVTDTGTGMSAEVRERCLEPFFTTKGDQGTGLGLAMVFGTLQRHQGTLEIESEPSRGTTFLLRLQAGRVPQDHDSDLVAAAA